MKTSRSPLKRLNASAGSGKTYSLTNAFVDLLFDSDIAPCESCRPRRKNARYAFSELLAITFTNLAANQMKDKVIRILKEYAFKTVPCADEAEREEKSRQAHAMLEAVFRQYGALNIRTIDSLLNQLVGLFALELGYPPQFETVFDSGEAAKELYDMLAAQSIENPEYSGMFRELCGSVFGGGGYESFFAKQSLAENVLAFVRYSVQNNVLFTPELTAELEEARAFFCGERERAEKSLKECAALLKKEIAQKDIKVNKRFLGPLENAQNGDFSSAYWQKEDFSLLTVKDNKADTQTAASLYEDMKTYRERCERISVFTESYRLAVPCIRLSSVIGLALAAYEKSRQTVNSQKIPFIIAGILGSENLPPQDGFLLRKKKEDILLSAAFCRLGTRLKHILYDEFQDTSTAQWLALKDLSAEALAGGGSVLFVGDVKQAIYGWRGGKASLFAEAPEELDRNFRLLSRENLPCNWRSLENVVAWNNAFFGLLSDTDTADMLSLLVPRSSREEIPADVLADVLERAADSLKKSYEGVRQEIDPARLAKVRGKGTVQVHMLKESEYCFNAAALALLPEMVQNLHRRHKQYGKIAVLTVNNAQASKVSQILLQHGIPVVSQGSLGLKEHPVIAEVIALLRFLADPLDDGAFCHVLLSRHILPGGFYRACPRSELADFLVKIRKTSCFTAFKEAYPAVWQKYFHVLVDGANLGTAYDMLCELYGRLGIMERNPDARVYLLRLREIAHLAEENGIMDLNAFLCWWDENGSAEKAPLPEGLNSVSVMTVHKSKGLEFDAVILPFHDFKIEPSADIHKIYLPYGGKEYPLYTKLKRVHGRPYFEALLEKIKECINVLYVGWTRAKAELHIFLPAVSDQGRESSWIFYRFMQAMLAELKNLSGKTLWDGQPFVFAENEDMLHYGENIEPVLADRSLRILEYALGSFASENGGEQLSSLSADECAQIDTAMAEYLTEGKEGKKASIGADDVLYAARILSRLLAAQAGKAEYKGQPREKAAERADGGVSEKEYSLEHSMDWLPQLRIFRTDLEELQGRRQLSSNKRGTLVHKSLEYLVFSGNLQEDCRRACMQAMKFLPFGRTAVQAAEAAGGDSRDGSGTPRESTPDENSRLFAEIQEKLLWAASLREPYGGAQLWFKYGYKEHCLADEAGNLFRVDLLVEIPENLRGKYGAAYVAVDYKTGYLGQDLPEEKNVLQIKNYIRLLQAATGKKAAGLLVYLDAGQCCAVEG